VDVPAPDTAVRTDLAEVYLRRTALLFCPAKATIQDHIDLAETALTTGDREAACLLLSISAMEMGTSAPGLAWRAEMGRRTGLWAVQRPPPVLPQPFMVDAAVDELRALIAIPADPPLPIDRDSIPRSWATEPAIEALLAFCRRVTARLQELIDAGPGASVAACLSDLAPEAQSWPFFDLSLHVGKSADILVRMVAFNRLKRFELLVRELGSGLFGSAGLLDAASCLSPHALGPYFTNVRHVVRDARDIPALVRLAAPAASTEDIARWTLLLSGQLPWTLACDLVGVAAQLGLASAVEQMYVRAERQAEFQREAAFLWRIRDDGLAMGLEELACRAQKLLTDWKPGDFIEWSILGDMLAVLSRESDARDAFEHCLSLNPRDEHARAALAALRDGSFNIFCRTSGFFASSERAAILGMRAQ